MSTSVPPPNARAPEDRKPAAPARPARAKVIGSVALVVIVAAVAFIVFGGSSSKVGGGPVAEAATVSAQAPGYRVRFSMVISSSATPTPITAVGSGAFDLRGHSGSMSLAMNFGDNPQVTESLGSSTLQMQEILSGTTVYMKLPAGVTGGLSFLGKKWISLNFAKLEGIPGLSSLDSNPLSSNPADMLQYLREVSDGVVVEGHQRVDGLQTTRYRAELSLARAADALPSADRAAAQQAMAKLEQLTQIQEIPVEVWVDAHHLVRQIQMNIVATPSGGPTVNETMTMDVTHYGPEPAPAVPAASQVQSLG